MQIPPFQVFLMRKSMHQKHCTIIAWQLVFGLNTNTDNSADDQFHDTFHNFITAHKASQTTIRKNVQIIKQQAESISQLTAQMNSLQNKLDSQQQQLHDAQANVYPPMMMPNQRQPTYQAPHQQWAYSGGGRGWSNNQHQGGGGCRNGRYNNTAQYLAAGGGNSRPGRA